MMQPWEVIKQLESDNSRKHKEKVLTAMLLQAPHDRDFWEGVRVALDPMVTFGVKQVPVKDTDDGEGLDFENFSLSIMFLAIRTSTGNAAQELIANMMQKATRDQWNYWYRRILIKDLRCGVTEATINKVRPNTVPIFACQLAKDAAEHENKLTGKKILDYKLDGVRVLASITSATSIGHGAESKIYQANLFSRNGKQFLNFPHIQEQLIAAAKKANLEDEWVLDGEITSSSFQDLMTQVHRKRDADAGDAVYNVFDAIPYNNFMHGYYENCQLNRSRELKEFALFDHCEHVKRLDYVVAELETDEGKATLEDMREHARLMGLEGVMVKDAHAPYECKRSANWLKIKPNITVDLAVIDSEEGTGRNEGRLGALICEGTDDGRSIRVNVGSGFSDLLRDSFWADRASLVGRIAEVKADAITKNQDGTYSLRFPRFVRFRGFEPGEKL